MDLKRNTFYGYGLDTATSFMTTLPSVQTAVVLNTETTITGFIKR